MKRKLPALLGLAPVGLVATLAAALATTLAAALALGCSGDDTDTPVDASTGAAPSDASVTDAANDAAPADAGADPCAEASSPPATLACTGLYADFATKDLAASAVAYTPATPLWSDGAQKARWVELPPNTQIDINDRNNWTFPVGTKFFKEFRVGGKRVETRMFQKETSNFWVYATYAWNSDDSAAVINYGGPVPVGNDGGTWDIPSSDDCNQCHSGRPDQILGFDQVGLGLPGAQGLTLAQLAAEGLLSPPPASVSLTIGDDGTGLDALAMGWLHVNCGVTCHNSNEGAPGYGTGMRLKLDPAQLDGTPPNPATWDILSTTVNVPCITGSLVGDPRILPGNPGTSVIYQLVNERGALQMPPVGTNLVDVPDVAVIRAWIQALGTDGGAPVDDDAGDHDAGHHRDGGGFGFDAGGDSGGHIDFDAGDSGGHVHDAGAKDATLGPSEDAGEDAGEDASQGASDDAD